MNALERYDLAIERLTSRIHDLRRAHPRPTFNDRARISYLITRQRRLVADRWKLRYALEDVVVYAHGASEYDAMCHARALAVIADLSASIVYYESLVSSELELAQGE